MSEPDHIFLRPLPNLMRGDAPAAFPFFYIEPHKADNLPVGGPGRSELSWFGWQSVRMDSCSTPARLFAALLQLQNTPNPPQIVKHFVPGGALTEAQAEEMAPIGNSPTFLTLKTMRAVMPLWANVSIEVFKDKEASEVGAGGCTWRDCGGGGRGCGGMHVA
jgi:hypothetical protein